MGNENNNKPSRPLSSFLPPVSSPKKEIGMIMSVSYNILNFLTSVGYQSCFYEKFCSDLKDSNITTLINGNEKTQFRDLNSMILSETKRNFEKKGDFFPDPIKLLNYSIYNGLNIFNLLDKNLPEKKELTLLNSKTITGYYSALKSKISNSNGPISLNFIEKQFIDSSHESKYFDIQLQHILETLENKSENIKEKYIIIISDGSLIKVSEKLNNLVREAKRNNIPIITLLLTKHKNRVKKLYNEFPNHLNEDIKNLFDITSKVKYNDVFGNYFIKKGWSFPEDGQGTLLFETDYSDLKNDSFAEDLNQISFNGIDIKLRQMSYNNLIHFKYNFIPKNQIFGTCWAYAYAAAIFLTNKTILGRKTISFENIRENLIKYASEKNSDGGNIENPSVINYFHSKKIYFRNVNEQVAKDALMKGSFIVCHFWLNNIQWENFSYYFYREKTKTKILNEDDLNKGCEGNVNPPKPDEGHAVLLIEIGPGFLRFLDSSGPDMGDKGTFKVKNADVLTSYTTNKKAEFFEIFVNEKDITKEELQYYKNNIDYIKELLSYYEDLSAKKIINAVKPLYELKYKCENCQNKLKIKQSLITIDNGFDKIKCSTCKFLNYRKDFLKKLLIMNNLLNDGNDDFNINFKENYYVDIDRIQLYEEFEEKNKFINESDSCSLGYLNIAHQKIDSPFTTKVNSIIHFKDNIFIACSSDMILIFELVIDIDKGKRHHSFNILIKEKIVDDIISTLFALKFNDFIITGGEYLNFFKFDYEEKKLTFSFKISESTKINKIIAFNENYIKKSEKIFVCDQNGFISLYDIHDNKGNLVTYLLFSQKCHKSSIDNILYLPEENFLISLCNKDLELKFWNINNEGLKSFKNINNYSFNANNN